MTHVVKGVDATVQHGLGFRLHGVNRPVGAPHSPPYSLSLSHPTSKRPDRPLLGDAGMSLKPSTRPVKGTQAAEVLVGLIYRHRRLLGEILAFLGALVMGWMAAGDK